MFEKLTKFFWMKSVPKNRCVMSKWSVGCFEWGGDTDTELTADVIGQLLVSAKLFLVTWSLIIWRALFIVASAAWNTRRQLMTTDQEVGQWTHDDVVVAFSLLLTVSSTWNWITDTEQQDHKRDLYSTGTNILQVWGNYILKMGIRFTIPSTYSGERVVSIAEHPPGDIGWSCRIACRELLMASPLTPTSMHILVGVYE